MKRAFLVTLVLLVFNSVVNGQQFLEIWPHGKIPNSKHLPLKDSIANERVYRVMTPGMGFSLAVRRIRAQP